MLYRFNNIVLSFISGCGRGLTLDAEGIQQLEEAVVDAATAAQTIAELDIEIAQLSELPLWPDRHATTARTASGASFVPAAR